MDVYLLNRNDDKLDAIRNAQIILIIKLARNFHQQVVDLALRAEMAYATRRHFQAMDISRIQNYMWTRLLQKLRHLIFQNLYRKCSALA